MGRRGRRLTRRLRWIGLAEGVRPKQPVRSLLVLWGSLVLGLASAALVLDNLCTSHRLALEAEADNLHAAFSQMLTSWDVATDWLAEVADAGALDDIALSETIDPNPIYPGFAWVGVARAGEDGLHLLYSAQRIVRAHHEAVIAHPAVRRALDRVLERPGSVLSEPFTLAGGPCEGPMAVLLSHDARHSDRGLVAYSPVCLQATLAYLVPRMAPFEMEVFVNGQSVFHKRLDDGARMLVRHRTAIEERGMHLVAEMASFPYPFNWQLALPIFLFLGISGVGVGVFAWSRIEERERLLAEAMLETYRLTQKHSQFLAEVSRLLAWHTDTGAESVLPRVASRAVPLLGQGCGICLLEDKKNVRVIVAHTDPDVEARLRRDFSGPIPLPGFAELLRGLAETKDKRIPDAALEGLLDPDSPEELRIAIRKALRWCIAVPMIARGRPIGAVVIRMTKGQRYGLRMIRVIHDLGLRIALALDNARLLRSQQEAIQAREEFISIASHELLTPVTALQTNIQSLVRLQRMGAEVSEARLARALEVAERQVRRLVHLVQELLDVSRIDAGLLLLDKQRFDLAELVEDLVIRYEKEAERQGCTITYSGRRGVWGVWDRPRVEQVVTNLLSNALKYGRSRPVHVKLEKDDEVVRLRIQDHGVGIPADALERIFSRFERAVTDRNYGGLGLGLYIANQIAEAHGGKIEVQSVRGSGSTFTLVLPRGNADAARPQADPLPLRESMH